MVSLRDPSHNWQMSPAILHRVIYGTPKPDPWQVERLTIHPALLPGYKRHRVRWADYPAITPYDALPTGANDGVRGTVVTGLADCDIARLEAFEGSQYERRPVTIKVLEGQGEGKELQAETFVWTAGVKLLDPKEWDFKHFMRERSRAWIGAEREDYEGKRCRPFVRCSVLQRTPELSCPQSILLLILSGTSR